MKNLVKYVWVEVWFFCINLSLLAADSNSGGAVVAGGVAEIFQLVFSLAVLIGMWKIFVKAGEPGWAVLIPFYNAIVLLRIAGKPAWWLLLLLIPFVNFIVIIIVMINLAKAFGKGVGFALGLIFLGFIFYPVLGFDDSRYLGHTDG